MPTFASWVPLPENRSARVAVARLAGCLCRRRFRPELTPLLLHGPSGAGKSHLVSALLARVSQCRPDCLTTLLTARDLLDADPESLDSADLIGVEDLQHLPRQALERAMESLVGLLDRSRARRQYLVLTANGGPAELPGFPGRLTSRLTAGLVVRLDSLGPASRRAFLEHQAQRRNLPLEPAVLDWLAEHLPGSARQLEGILTRLETLAHLNGRTPTLPEVVAALQVETELQRPSVERIARRVCAYFQVEPRQMQSRQRCRPILLSRQVGIYLARKLTGLSLQQIGAYFGGLDHSTVLHACRKVEQALNEDLTLSGAVHQLATELA
jgi:chromosomal replication initiator protein